MASEQIQAENGSAAGNGDVAKFEIDEDNPRSHLVMINRALNEEWLPEGSMHAIGVEAMRIVASKHPNGEYKYKERTRIRAMETVRKIKELQIKTALAAVRLAEDDDSPHVQVNVNVVSEDRMERIAAMQERLSKRQRVIDVEPVKSETDGPEAPEQASSDGGAGLSDLFE